VTLRWHIQRGDVVFPSRQRRRGSERSRSSTSNWSPKTSPQSVQQRRSGADQAKPRCVRLRAALICELLALCWIARSARCGSRQGAAHFVVIRRRKACRLVPPQQEIRGLIARSARSGSPQEAPHWQRAIREPLILQPRGRLARGRHDRTQERPGRARGGPRWPAGGGPESAWSRPS
jgi:hypothetical protein